MYASAIPEVRACIPRQVQRIQRHWPFDISIGPAAGQGYIWLAHREMDCPAWHLAARSKDLWQHLLPRQAATTTSGSKSFGSAVQWQASPPFKELESGKAAPFMHYARRSLHTSCAAHLSTVFRSLPHKAWKALTQGPRRGCQRPEERCCHGLQGNGSLLLAREAEDAAALQVRAEALAARGVAAEALTARQVRALEPHLALPDGGAALLVPGDAQLVGCPSQMHRKSAVCLHTAMMESVSPPENAGSNFRRSADIPRAMQWAGIRFFAR